MKDPLITIGECEKCGRQVELTLHNGRMKAVLHTDDQNIACEATDSRGQRIRRNPRGGMLEIRRSEFVPRAMKEVTP